MVDKKIMGILYVLIILSVLSIQLVSAAPYLSTEQQTSNALVVLNSSDISSMQQSREYIESRGGNIIHIYPPHILIGYIPEEISQDVIGQRNIVNIHCTAINSCICLAAQA